MEIRDTRYAKTPDGVYVAYQTEGEGPLDAVWKFDAFGNVDLVWEELQTSFLGVISRSGYLLDVAPLQDPIQVPGVWDAFQLVLAGALEDKPRASH